MAKKKTTKKSTKSDPSKATGPAPKKAAKLSAPKGEKPAAKPAPKAKKKAAKTATCGQRLCKKASVSHGYCRLHYLKNWREIKDDEKVRAERRLNAYVDRLAKRYPDDYLERIKEGIENEDVFKKTMEQLDLELDPDTDSETEREYLEKFARNIKTGD